VIHYEQQGQIGIVRIANPPLNLLTRQMMRELHDRFEALQEDTSINVVVLAATGDRAFCAGLDLNERLSEVSGQGAPQTASEVLDPGQLWRETQGLVRHLPVPVVAAVDGIAVGGGFGLVGMCDIIIASERAAFRLNEINVGVLGGASKALRMLGPYKTRTMFFTGDAIPATEFYRLGAVEEVTPPGQAEARAMELAARLAAKSPIALRLAKESLVRIEYMDVESAYRVEQDYTRQLANFNDAREAMRSFVEKREPNWTWT
jgi:enoyl-CoA hydratase